MHFAAIPLRNLWRRPARAGFAAAGIALAVGAFLAMTVLFGGIGERWRQGLSGAGVHAIIVQEGQIDWLASSVPEAIVATVAAVPGVRAAEGELLAFVTTAERRSILASGWGAGSALFETLEAAGPPLPAALAPDEVLIGAPLADALGLATGAEMELDGLALRVAGVFVSGDPLLAGRVILPLPTLQAHLFREGGVTFLHVILADPSDPAPLQEIATLLNRSHPGLGLRETARMAEDNRILEILEALRSVVIWTVALAGFAGTANVMLMAANERRAEIGLLVAVGWSPGRILSLFLIEALLIGLAGALGGVALGALVVAMVRETVTAIAFLAGPLDLGAAVQAMALGMTIGALAGIAPALRVLRVPADTALRAV